MGWKVKRSSNGSNPGSCPPPSALLTQQTTVFRAIFSLFPSGRLVFILGLHLFLVCRITGRVVRLLRNLFLSTDLMGACL